MKRKPTIVVLAVLTTLLTQSAGYGQEVSGTQSVDVEEPPHAAAWASTLLFYDSISGAGATGRLNEYGQFEQLAQIGFSPGWTYIVNTPNGVLFYNYTTGAVAVARVNADGSVSTLSVDAIESGYSGVISTENGVFFYSSGPRSGLIGQVTSDGRFVVTQRFGSNSFGFWDHIVSQAGGRIFFYNFLSMEFAAGYIRPGGTFITTDSGYMTKRWPTVVPIHDSRGDSILFYFSTGTDQFTGQHAIGYLDGAGKFHLRPTSCAPELDTYRVISQAGDSILFYNLSGKFAIAAISGDEVIDPNCRGQLRLKSVYGDGYLPDNFTRIVGSGDQVFFYSGYLAQYLPFGHAMVGTVTPSGSLDVTAVYEQGSFSSWSHILAVEN